MSIDRIEEEMCVKCSQPSPYECSTCCDKYCGPCAADTQWLCPNCDENDLTQLAEDQQAGG